MSAAVRPGRMTHRYEGELVVFLIGMRVNKPWRLRQWWPVFAAMPGMLAELAKDPESGMLGYRLTVGAGGPLVIQYWNSVDKLYAYAGDHTALHRPAWAKFNQRARKAPGVVGIWHETFQVGRAESIYSGMPPSGLGKATTLVPVGRRGDTARQRIEGGRTGEAARSPAGMDPTKASGQLTGRFR